MILEKDGVSAMQQVKECSKVTIDFTLRTTSRDGTVSESPPGTCSFVYGVDVQYPSVEAALLNKKPGDRVQVYVPPEEIFGRHDPELVRELPRSDYREERLRVGKVYREMKNRCLIQFLVKEIREETIIADFNDPRAGAWAEFDIVVKEVREATPEEMKPSCARG